MYIPTWLFVILTCFDWIDGRYQWLRARSWRFASFINALAMFSLLIALPAFGAPIADAVPIGALTRAIAVVDVKTMERIAVIGDDTAAYFVRVRDLDAPSCGTSVSINVARMRIAYPTKAGGETTELSAVHITTNTNDGMMVLLMDLNADGLVDQIAPQGAMTREDAQPLYARTITCIAHL